MKMLLLCPKWKRDSFPTGSESAIRQEPEPSVDGVRSRIRDAKSANDGGGEGRAVLDRNEDHTEAIVLSSRRVGSNRSASHLCATADWSREDGKRVFPTKVGFGQ